jgi:hypothetical protein
LIDNLVGLKLAIESLHTSLTIILKKLYVLWRSTSRLFIGAFLWAVAANCTQPVRSSSNDREMMNLSDVPLAETQDTGVAGEPDGQVSMQSCGKVDQNHSVSRPEDLKDLENCTRFLGSLRFGDTGLSEVDGLENLHFIDGRLIFFRNSNLVSIDGLMNLETVGELCSLTTTVHFQT